MAVTDDIKVNNGEHKLPNEGEINRTITPNSNQQDLILEVKSRLSQMTPEVCKKLFTTTNEENVTSSSMSPLFPSQSPNLPTSQGTPTIFGTPVADIGEPLIASTQLSPSHNDPSFISRPMDEPMKITANPASRPPTPYPKKVEENDYETNDNNSINDSLKSIDTTADDTVIPKVSDCFNNTNSTTVVMKQDEEALKDTTLTKQDADDQDKRYLFQTLGELLESAKSTETHIKQIPVLVDSIEKLRTTFNKEISDLSGRVLLVEEDVQKIKSFSFTSQGKSIVMENKSRISSVEQQKDVLQHSVDAMQQNYEVLKEELRSSKSKHNKRLDEMDIVISALKLRTNDNINDQTLAYEGWDEERVKKIETQMNEMASLREQMSKLKNPAATHNQKHPNTVNQKVKKTREPNTYTHVNVENDAVLLTDSNGRCISAKKIEHDGGVERHTCYTLSEVSTFIKEAKVSKQPSKVLIQVGTNDLTEHKDANQLLNDLKDCVKSLVVKFPQSKVYVSTLLPRKDQLHAAAMKFNQLLDNTCDQLRVRLVTHVDIQKRDLYDKLHLHEGGFFKFVWNINRTVFGLAPPPPRRSRR